MSDGERKSRLHIHLGGLVILIIIILVLFKVDIKSKIQSPQFQKNYTYISTQITNAWQRYVLGPLKTKAGDLFKDITDKGLQKIQDNFTNNVIKPITEEDVNNITENN